MLSLLNKREDTCLGDLFSSFEIIQKLTLVSTTPFVGISIKTFLDSRASEMNRLIRRGAVIPVLIPSLIVIIHALKMRKNYRELNRFPTNFR